MIFVDVFDLAIKHCVQDCLDGQDRQFNFDLELIMAETKLWEG